MTKGATCPACKTDWEEYCTNVWENHQERGYYDHENIYHLEIKCCKARLDFYLIEDAGWFVKILQYDNPSQTKLI